VNILKFNQTEPAEPVIPVEVQRIVIAANAGDRSALPALKKALADHPDLIDKLGDLAGYVELQLVSLVAGPSLAASETVSANLARMRRDLGEDAATPLERLLIKRVALCWLAVHAAEIDRGERLQAGASELLKAADQRVSRAHARFVTATKALATVRKLLGPAAPKLTLLPAPHETPKTGCVALPATAG
jgi:hypothetical protein